jgi:hypothetical protein
MGIGGAILLIVIGLILALALNVSVSGIDLQLVGWILVAAGLVWLVATFALVGPRRRRTVVVDRSAPIDPVDGYRDGYRVADRPADPRVVRERTIDEDPY